MSSKHHPPTSGSDAPRSGASSLLRGLLRKFQRAPSPGNSMPAPGQRSGEGSASIEPYLKEARTTRPGSLE